MKTMEDEKRDKQSRFYGAMNVATDVVVAAVCCIAILLGIVWLRRMKVIINNQKTTIDRVSNGAVSEP